ncbi:unnamed protein product [Vitrella brassicaformis CCMP3155]|uniref:Methyltransferase type 11 domain-containing protein n=2 Tax=Vitrella brassicaformis TaxID=1169539 RepID=A0A0G4FMH3_VITBC|nr:unnamed protein product [Vitrella brassicaformis CCMP3155]|eukprot:CEM15041.1 unnamed protein product [Vitrella brassicaformis CCMP3155]
MELLPSELQQFRQRSFWDRFFLRRGRKAFEWYGEYRDIRAILRGLGDEGSGPHAPPSSLFVLNVGCGNSELSGQMFDDGYLNIWNVDFSDLVLKAMRAKSVSSAGLEWCCMDMTRTAFRQGLFDLVIDKGALDAFLTGEGVDLRREATRFLDEMWRLLCDGGHYVCITLAQDYIIKELVRYFFSRRVGVRCHPFSISDAATTHTSSARHQRGDIPSAERQARLQPFMLIFQKMPQTASGNDKSVKVAKCAIYPESMAAEQQHQNGEGPAGKDGPESAMEPLQDTSIFELPKHVLEINKHRVWKETIATYRPGQYEVINLIPPRTAAAGGSSSSSSAPNKPPPATAAAARQSDGGGGEVYDISAKYHIAVFDNPQHSMKRKNTSAVIIVPRGRENEWMFSTPEGSQELASQVYVKRLLVTTFGMCDSSHHTPSMDDVKAELQPFFRELVLPSTSEEAPKIMTLGSETDTSTPVAEVMSKHAGRILVRDVRIEPEGTKRYRSRREANAAQPAMSWKSFARQMVFACNPGTVQSEVLYEVWTKTDDEPSARRTSPKRRGGRGSRKKKSSQPQPQPSEEPQVDDATTDAPQPFRFNFLHPTCRYHEAIIVGLACLPPSWLLELNASPASSPSSLLDDPTAPSSAFTANEQPRLRVTILGLGAGILASTLSALCSYWGWGVHIIGVDNDEKVLQMAKQHFGFEGMPMKSPEENIAEASHLASQTVQAVMQKVLTKDTDGHTNTGNDSAAEPAEAAAAQEKPADPPAPANRVEYMIGDALAMVSTSELSRVCPALQHIIIVDINTNQPDSHLTCPPSEVLQPVFLQQLASRLLPGGLLAINLVTRSVTARQNAHRSLCAVFPHVVQFRVPEDINEVLLCQTDHQGSEGPSAASPQRRKGSRKGVGSEGDDIRVTSGDALYNRMKLLLPKRRAGPTVAAGEEGEGGGDNDGAAAEEDVCIDWLDASVWRGRFRVLSCGDNEELGS